MDKKKRTKQSDLAQAVGCTQSQISRYVNAQRRPPWATAKALGKETGTTPDLWMDGTREQLRYLIRNGQEMPPGRSGEDINGNA